MMIIRGKHGYIIQRTGNNERSHAKNVARKYDITYEQMIEE